MFGRAANIARRPPPSPLERNIDHLGISRPMAGEIDLANFCRVLFAPPRAGCSDAHSFV